MLVHSSMQTKIQDPTSRPRKKIRPRECRHPFPLESWPAFGTSSCRTPQELLAEMMARHAPLVGMSSRKFSHQRSAEELAPDLPACSSSEGQQTARHVLLARDLSKSLQIVGPRQLRDSASCCCDCPQPRFHLAESAQRGCDTRRTQNSRACQRASVRIATGT